MIKKIIIIITSLLGSLLLISFIFFISIFLFIKTGPRSQLREPFKYSGPYKLYKVLDSNNEEQTNFTNIHLNFLDKDSKIIYNFMDDLKSKMSEININFTLNGNNLITVTNKENDLIGYIQSYSDYIVMFVKNKNNELFKVFFRHIE